MSNLDEVDLATLTPAVPLGPLDGRYREQTAKIVNYFSEPALNRVRIKIEVEWLVFLVNQQVIPDMPVITPAEINYLKSLPNNFGTKEISHLAQIEAVTRHDVKAIEYLLKSKLENPDIPAELSNLAKYKEVVHIFCTSEDINNLAYSLNIKAAVNEVWLPEAKKIVEGIEKSARIYAKIPMLARTHGQTASPTTVGKELAVFVYRLKRQLKKISNQEYLGKINGATGTFGAHVVGLPKVDWPKIACEFVENLGLTWNPLTTQIESHDWQAELYDCIARFGRILHNFATDMWTYISLGYFHQDLKQQGSTGSSTMPHKVNPIRFENAEANLEISNSLFRTLSETLTTSRLQRDLTDSSTQRNIGVAFGHSLLAIDNLCKGLAGVEVNQAQINKDIDAAWEVISEPIQQTMRVAALAGATGMENPYERLKELTRGKRLSYTSLREFILNLGLDPIYEQRILAITPQSYVGLADKIVDYLEGK